MITRSIFSTLLLSLIVTSGATISSSCVSRKPTESTERKRTLPLNANVPANVSELREVKYSHSHKEDGDKDVHIIGQLFKKTVVNGVQQISPCSSCIIHLDTPTDTSIHINLTTEWDGYFTYHGKSMPYSLSVNMPGYNRIEIGAIEFIPEGKTSLLIVNGTGGGATRFTLTKNENSYTWR